MAEITTNQLSTKRIKHSTKVDLTPMVDLGFLLITFFIFTTTISESKAMGLVVPTDEVKSNPTTISEEKTIQLLLSNNAVFYYYGNAYKNMQSVSYSAKGIRQVLIEKQKSIHKKFGSASEMVVCIKPLNESAYKHLIEVLDEMAINGIKKYIVMDADVSDIAHLQTISNTNQ
jgi:biopolymer transport protein ExbD